jgi:rubrerythrin
MAIMFDPSEVFQLAIRIEENGEKFYRSMAEKLQDPQVKELFLFLADEEVGHKNFYKDILSKIDTFEPYESYPGEYFSYLRAYANNIIFSEKTFEVKLEQIADALSAIDFAIKAELDSILYYQEIKKLVPEKKHVQIDEIIEEERRHFVKLTDIKNKI